MRVNLLCPGPSLANYGVIAATFPTIGVNRAVFHSRCDWWVASDYPFLRDYGPQLDYDLNLFTIGDSWASASRHSPPWTKRIKRVEFIDMIENEWPECGWNEKTATRALVAAAHLRATTIDVYGADMLGETDWDGHNYEDLGGMRDEEKRRRRDAKRWEIERKNWHATVAVLAHWGVTVIRHTIGAAEITKGINGPG